MARLKHRRRAGCRWLVLLSFIRRLTSAAAAAPFKKFSEFNDGCDGCLSLKMISALRGSKLACPALTKPMFHRPIRPRIRPCLERGAASATLAQKRHVDLSGPLAR